MRKTVAENARAVMNFFSRVTKHTEGGSLFSELYTFLARADRKLESKCCCFLWLEQFSSPGRFSGVEAGGRSFPGRSSNNNADAFNRMGGGWGERIFSPLSEGTDRGTWSCCKEESHTMCVHLYVPASSQQQEQQFSRQRVRGVEPLRE